MNGLGPIGSQRLRGLRDALPAVAFLCLLTPLFLATLALLLPLSQAAAAAAGTVNGKIAFLAGGDLYVMNPDGTNKTNLTNSKAIEEAAEFSPDGTRIAFVRAPGDIWVMNADGTNQTKITNVADRIEGMTWSDDESTIFYLADRDANPITSEIYAVEADGSSETMLHASGPAIDSGAGLSTAANKIVFSSSAGLSNDEIFVINTDGTGLLRVTNDPGSDTSPVISPTATKIAWSTDRHNPPNQFSTDSEIYIANVNGTGAQRLTNTKVGNFAAAFFADATKLGFNRNGEASITNVNGTGVVKLVPGDNAFDYFEQFSADGKRVAINHVLPLPGEDPHFTIMTTRLDGSNRKTLTTKADDASFADWQYAAQAPTDPPLTLAVEASSAASAKKARALFTCSNECEIRVKVEVKAGGKLFSSSLTRSIYGNEPTKLKLLKRNLRRKLDGKRGSAEVKVIATDDFGARKRDEFKFRLKR